MRFQCECGKLFRSVKRFPLYCSCRKENFPPDNRATDEPGTVQKVVSVARAYTGWAAAGFPKRTAEQIVEVKAICEQCDKYRNGACSLCGCNLAKKIPMATEKCPLGKWPVSTATQEQP